LSRLFWGNPGTDIPDKVLRLITDYREKETMLFCQLMQKSPFKKGGLSAPPLLQRGVGGDFSMHLPH
jgi:hypothetical protein